MNKISEAAVHRISSSETFFWLLKCNPLLQNHFQQSNMGQYGLKDLKRIVRRFANFILSDYILCTACLLENRGITVLVKLGNCDTWNKEKFKVRSYDLMNDDIFISLPHVKRTTKNFWATVWKYFVIRILFKIVLTKHSFDSANLPKRQDQLYWSEIFYMKFSFSSNIHVFVIWNI